MIILLVKGVAHVDDTSEKIRLEERLPRREKKARLAKGGPGRAQVLGISHFCQTLYLASSRATELLPGLVEKDMNWIDFEVVGVNDMTFTRYETISKMSSSSDEKPSVK